MIKILKWFVAYFNLLFISKIGAIPISIAKETKILSEWPKAQDTISDVLFIMMYSQNPIINPISGADSLIQKQWKTIQGTELRTGDTVRTTEIQSLFQEAHGSRGDGGKYIRQSCSMRHNPTG